MPADDEVARLEARVGELERRMDQVLSRIGYLPGDTPLIRDEAHWRVDPDVLDIARSGKDKDVARAVYEHIKRTGAEPETAKQAVQRALAR
ncbi:MAG TPA: hypothetical protein VKE97_03160 [Acidimicrobiia bacterium]|nr:hypothetical protein [Acidimicrobiia bacterium]